ncbi:MAG: type II toxin-antitoxin system HicA family toxin [Ignavibacteriota bacterium]
MRIPRDWSGADLISKLSRMGYGITRQSGSHIRLTRPSETGDHHVTVPMHSRL